MDPTQESVCQVTSASSHPVASSPPNSLPAASSPADWEGDRREFLQAVSALSAGIAVAGGTASAAAEGPQFNIGLIGPGGMGTNHLGLLSQRKDLRVSYVCDVDARRLAAAAQLVEKNGQPAPQAVSDLRRILDDKSIDAVWIATPDHWHAPATILACHAGKHVYVEKPCSHNLREGRLMLEAARKQKRVVQVGTQSRSTAHVRKAMELLREGIIGDVLVAKAWNSQKRGNIGHQKPSAVPDYLDYEAWLGPAPKRPYQSNMLPGVWRFWHEYGAGDIGNDGVHDIDIARWGLGVTTQPEFVTGAGSKYFFDDDQQFPDNQYCTWEWQPQGAVGTKRMLVYEQRDWSPYVQEGAENGNAFYGTKGMMWLSKSLGFQVYRERNKPTEKMSGSPDLPAHHQNFLDCIRSGERPNADVEEGHLSASLVHLGNIVCRTGRTLKFDPKAEAVIGDDEAQKLLTREYSSHWSVPHA